MSQIKVLAVIDSLGRGGAEQVLVNIAPSLIERGYKFEVAALWPPYDLAEGLEQHGVLVHRLGIDRAWNIPQAVARLATLISLTRPDVVHSNLFFATMYTAFAKRLCRNPRTVTTFHNLEYYSYPPNTIMKKARVAFDGLVTRTWIDRYTAVSHVVADYCFTVLGLQPISVIPNPIIVGATGALSRAERDLLRGRHQVSSDNCVLAVVGRFVPLKGHQVFLDALELLAKSGLRPRVIMIGDGPLKSSIVERVNNSGLESQVTLVPPMEHEALMKLLDTVDALAMPSLYEGFGLAAAEAMSLGLPVVVTHTTGLSELVEDGISGLLVPPRNPQALSEAIAQLMTDSGLREKLGRAAQSRVQEHFSLAGVTDQWDVFYQELTGCSS